MKALCVTVRDPFRPMHGRTVVEVQRRRRIRALAPRTAQPFIAVLNGKPVLRAGWGRRLRDGDSLAFVVLPQGGGGGSDPMRVALTIALVVAAWYVSPMIGAAIGVSSAGGMAAIQMGVMMAGSMLINALLPPPKLGAASAASALSSASPTYSLQAQGNSARLDAPIPVLYGRHLVYPDFASQPYAEYSGNDQYLYQLFCVTQGLALIEEIRVADAVLDAAPANDGAIHTAAGVYADVSYQIVQPGGSVTLFPSRVTTSADVSGQEALTGVALGPFPASPSGTVCNSIAVDLVFPRGLYYANDDGSLGSKTVQWIVEAAPINDAGSIVGAWATLSADTVYSEWSAWTQITYTPTPPADTVTQQWQNVVYGTADSGDIYATQTRTRTATTGVDTFAAATATPQRQTYRYTVSPGRYTVRLTRTDTKDTSTRAAHEVDWVGLRAYIPGSQEYGNVTLLALRMRATNQLSSASARKVNVLAQRHLPVWTGSAWVTQATRSIAWAFADAARNATYGAKLPDARLDIAGLLALDAEWASRGDSYDGVFDSLGTCWEALTQIARAGRAMPVYQGGILYAVRDQEQTLPVALFTPRNIVRNSLKLDYSLVTEDTCDGVEVSYYDADVWSWQTVACQLPGDTYLQPAKVKLQGVTDRDQAWREGMYMAAANRYRRRFGSHQTEMEGLIPRVGDLIAISHDMPKWGQSGEIISWTTLEPGTTLTLSEPVVGSGAMYLAIAGMDGSVHSRSVTAVDGSPVVTLTDANTGLWFPDPYLRERLRYAIGVSGDAVYIRARVLTIRPASPEHVDVSWVVESDSVHAADATGSAPFAPSWQLPGVPSAPVVVGLKVQVVPGDQNKAQLSWFPAPGAASYIVDQSADGVTWVRCAEVAATSWVGMSLKGAGTLYRVAAVGVVVGPWCIPVALPAVIPPSNVTGFAAYNGRQGTVLSWDSVTDLTRQDYEIRIGATWAAGVLVARTGATSFDLGLLIVGTYKYWIAARDVFGNYSLAPTSVTAVKALPADPTISVAAGNYAATVSWTFGAAADDIDGVEVWANSGNDRTTAARIATAAYPATEYTHTGLGRGQTVYYWIRVRDTAGNYSAWAPLSPTAGAAATTTGDTMLKGISLTAPSALFQVASGGTATPSAITLTADLKNITGTISFSVLSGSATLSSVTSTTATLAYADMVSDSVTIRASVTDAGLTYTAEWTIAKVRDGANGQRTATLTMYKWSATSPTSYPSGTSTYTWATGAFTAPTTANGWSLTPPAAVAGQTLWGISTVLSDALTTSTSSAAWASSSPFAIGAAGTSGNNGLNVATAYIYQRTATDSAPSLPSATVTYTFGSGAMSGLNNGWSATIPAASGGAYLWVSIATASNTTSTDTISSGEWAAAQKMAQNGADGASGANSAVVYIYQRAASTPALPSATTTYTFATQTLTGLNNGWTTTIPAGSNPLYVSAATASSSGTTDTITSGEWATPVVLAQDGAAGINSATVYLFQRTASATAPSLPSASVTYTFATGAASGLTNGWTQSMPTSGGAYRWMTTATALSASATDTIGTAEWAAAALVAQDGVDGSNGTRTAILDVYQWAASAPTTFPSGTSTYTWATGQFSAPATLNGWSLTPPAAVAGQTLWIARTVYADSGTSATTSITWSASTARALGGAGSNGTNGTNGQRLGVLEVYQWALSAPTSYPSGTSTYTWATGAFTGPTTPNGWSVTPGAPIAGYTLWAISTVVSDTLTTSTSTATWSSSTVYAVGAAGSNGSTGATGQSARRAYVVTTSSTPPTVTAGSGDVVPTNVPAGQVTGKGWSFSAYSSLAAGEIMYQVDGLYTAGGNIAWGNAYLSYLKVGSLSAIAADLGTVTISTTGSLSSSGTAFGGTGFFLGYSGAAYKFSVGNATNYLQWDGSSLTFTGDLVTSGKVQATGSWVNGTGYSTAVSGVSPATGVYGGSTAAMGVVGNTSAGATFFGVLGLGNSANGGGVQGQSSATSSALGYGVGVYGQSINGNGVYGTTSISDRSRAGVYGVGGGTAGLGVYASGGMEASSTIRTTGGNSPAAGAGVEVLYSASVGYVQSYDRGASAYKPLYISGSKVVFNGAGTGAPGNVGIGVDPSATGGVGVLAMLNATTVPTTNISGGSFYLVNGALYFRGGSGTVSFIAPA